MGIVLPATTLLWPVCAGLLAMLCMAVWRLRAMDHSRLMLEVELYGLANHDNLTGLFNRQRFDDEVAGHLARVRRYGGPTTVMVIDLDRFGEVNHDLGRAVGDALLTSVARGIYQRLRESDVAARLEGDTFAVLLPEVDAEGAAKLANDLLAAVRSSVVEVPDAGIASNTASIGVAYDADSANVSSRDLIEAADGALQKAKRSRGDSVAFAEPIAAGGAHPTWAA